MLHKESYKDIFTRIETNLLTIGSETIAVEEIRKNLDKYKYVAGRSFSDSEYYKKSVSVVFYSGFKAATVSAKINIIYNHFPDYETVAAYDETRVAEIYEDREMIRNRNKIKACLNNAKTFKKIVEDFGSFQSYVDSFAANESFENLLLLKEELESKFSGFGRITTFHFLTIIGLPVLKPDRVICRIFKRLSLIENENQLLKTIIHGRKFAEATNLPIRYVDIVFVAYGQMRSLEFGIEKGICLEKQPACHQCTVTEYCNYYLTDE